MIVYSCVDNSMATNLSSTLIKHYVCVLLFADVLLSSDEAVNHENN